MRGDAESAQRDAILWSLRRRKFTKVQAAGADALVTFSPEGTKPRVAFEYMTYLAGIQRLYPTEGGWLLKWPYQGQAFDPALFRIEPGGWDHKHCSVCNASIQVDEVCWITERGSFYVLCRACHRRLARMGRGLTKRSDGEGAKRGRQSFLRVKRRHRRISHE
jgi:hypothetical protein